MINLGKEPKFILKEKKIIFDELNWRIKPKNTMIRLKYIVYSISNNHFSNNRLIRHRYNGIDSDSLSESMLIYQILI